MNRRRAWSVLVVISTTVTVAACTSSVPPQAAASPLASLPVESSVESMPQGSPSPASSDGPFRSSIYPYQWLLPYGTATRAWHPATRSWNGTERVDSTATYDDQVGTRDGGVFVFGATWPGSLAEFETRVLDNAAEPHGCLPPTDCRHVLLADEPAEAIGQVCSGVSVVRIVSVHRHVRVVVSEQAAARDLSMATSDLIEWLAGWRWTT